MVIQLLSVSEEANTTSQSNNFLLFPRRFQLVKNVRTGNVFVPKGILWQFLSLIIHLGMFTQHLCAIL